HFAVNHARRILAISFILLVGAGALGFTAFSKLQSEGFVDPAAESSQATELIDSRFDGSADLLFLASVADGTVDDPAAHAAGVELSERLAEEPALTGVVSYFQTDAPTMHSTDRTHALVIAQLNTGDDVDDTAIVSDLAERYQSD